MDDNELIVVGSEDEAGLIISEASSGDEIVIIEGIQGPPGPSASSEFDGEHNDLDGRDAEDAHPMEAITGLVDFLQELLELADPVVDGGEVGSEYEGAEDGGEVGSEYEGSTDGGEVESGGSGSSGPVAFSDLTDVDVTTDPPEQDDFVAWDDTLEKWKPVSFSGSFQPLNDQLTALAALTGGAFGMTVWEFATSAELLAALDLQAGDIPDLSGSYDALGAAQAVADSLGSAAAADTGDFAAASHSHPGSAITLTAPDGSGNLSTGATDVQTLADEVDGLVLGGDGAPMFPYVRRFNGNIPLTSAYWSAVPAGNYVYASNQTTPSENGIKVTNGTTTLTNVATPTGSFILDVKEVFATFGDFPSTSTAGITLLLPSGFNFTTDTPSNDQGPSTLHSQATGNPHNVTAAEVGAIPATTLDADTILKADSDDTPVALPVAPSTLVGRGATGGITALSVAQIKALLAYTAGDVGADAAGAATAAQAAAVQRANHTGTQLASTVSDFATAVATTAPTKALLTTKGDLYAATAAGTPARLAIGINAQVLTADSAEATGMKWATASGSSGGGALVPLGTAGGGTAYLSQSNVTATDKVMALGTLYYVPVQVPRAMTLDRITFNNIVAYAGKTARLGIYTPATTGLPGSLLLDAGNVSMASVAVMEVTISQAVSTPMIWLAVGGPDVAFWVKAATFVISNYNTSASNTTRIVGVQQSYTMGAALPSSAAPTANTVDWTIDTRARIA